MNDVHCTLMQRVEHGTSIISLRYDCIPCYQRILHRQQKYQQTKSMRTLMCYKLPCHSNRTRITDTHIQRDDKAKEEEEAETETEKVI